VGCGRDDVVKTIRELGPSPITEIRKEMENK
jgi:hypothetical protein